ncbi:MAG: hypothetical protein GY703_03115 [Gammaproteobacteria bacterium]|nr:hypothetical protein [Gammaproteobacteria bacterium]
MTDVVSGEGHLSPRFLVTGSVFAFQNILDGFNWTTDTGSNFDLVCCLPGTDFSELTATLSRERLLLSPIVDLGVGIGTRADYTAPASTGVELQNALQATLPLRQRIRHIPDHSNSADYESLTSLALAYSRDTPINAHWNANLAHMVDYPLLGGVREPRRLLEDLSGQELLTPKFFDRLHQCRNCQSARLNVREECPSCRSSQLHEVSLIHHYPCGFQGTEDKYRVENDLECPKCRKRLHHYGVDYDRPSDVYVCTDCSGTASEPVVGFVCADCNEHQQGDNASRVDWFHYELTPKGISAIESGALPSTSLKTMLERSIGIVPQREFLQSFSLCSKIANRYDRPFTALRLRIVNLADLQSELGVGRINNVLSLLGEVLSQVLRDTDFLTVQGHDVIMLFPETRFDNLQVLHQRIRDGLAGSFGVKLDLKLEQYSADKIEALFRKTA